MKLLYNSLLCVWSVVMVWMFVFQPGGRRKAAQVEKKEMASGQEIHWL